MRNAFKFFLFVLAFQMEVRVKATGEILQDPEDCIKTQAQNCAIQILKSTYHFKSENLTLHAPKDSTLMRLDSTTWRMVRGTLWAEESTGIEFQTPYAKIKAASGQYWLFSQDDRILIRNIDADLAVTLADGKTLAVPQGFEFWVAGINSKGHSEYGMIQPIPLKEHLLIWSSLYPGDKNTFIEEARIMNEKWGNLSERSALVYRDEVSPHVTTVANKEHASEEIRERESQERKKNKRLFFDRTFKR